MSKTLIRPADTGGHDNLYVTQCKVCDTGVYRTQAWVWSRHPLGICHIACLERAR